MYHGLKGGFGGEQGSVSRSPSAYAPGRGASPYSSGSHQADLYPSPYQTRHRLHSKHGTRGFKRRANTSTGGDGLGAALGSSGTMSSASSHPRERNECDRFLVDINNGGQRSGSANHLFHTKKEATASENPSVSSGGTTWPHASAYRNTRLGGSGRSTMAQTQRSGFHAGGCGSAGTTLQGTTNGRTGGSSAGHQGGVEAFVGTGRMNVPQRYTRSRERLEANAGSGAVGISGVSRRGARHRGGYASVTDVATGVAGKLPSIGGGGVCGGMPKEATAGVVRGGYSKAQLGETKQLIVRAEGCEASGVCTIQGHKPGNPRWENQDNFVRGEDLAQTGGRLFVALDGHGELGHFVSRRCSEMFSKFMLECGWNVVRATSKMSDDLKSSPVDCSSSGATCLVTTIRGDKICVANLGDSKCVLARVVNGQLRAVPLSEDHKPDRPDEMERILAIGGQVGSRHLVVGSNASGPIRIPMGPARVWYRCRGEIMGLAMSRSLGDDIAHQAGVSSEPEIMEHNIDSQDKFLIMATDGVWDVTETGQAVQMVQGYASQCGGEAWDPQGAASYLAHTARKRWENLSAVVDDITAMVVRLNLNPQ